MQNVAILSAVAGVANAAQVIFAIDGAASSTYMGFYPLVPTLTGAIFEEFDVVHIPAAVLTDDCFDISWTMPFGNFSAFGKLNCNATGIVDTYGMYSDSKCSVKLTQPAFFSDPAIPTGSENPATLGINFMANNKLNMPFSQFQMATGYCKSPPAQVINRVPYTAASCTSQATISPIGTAVSTGFARADPAVMAYASGKCYAQSPDGAQGGRFLRVTSSGITFYDNNLPTSMVLSAAQCVDTGVTAGQATVAGGGCRCSSAGVAGSAVSSGVCTSFGARCIDSTGADAGGETLGTCAFLAGDVVTTSGSSDGAALRQCGYTATGTITPGVWSELGSVCVCFDDSQCAASYYCLQDNGQKPSATEPGTCGRWSPLAVSNPMEPTDARSYTGCSVSAQITSGVLGSCDTKTNSIWRVASANMFAVSAASVVVAMASLFA